MASEAAKQKAREAQERITAEMEKLEETGAWEEYLTFAGRFHNYSVGNIMLILAQFPEAMRVAGYRRWQQMGRQVRKGEKGITILAPRQGPCWGCTSAAERKSAKGKRSARGSGCDRCSGKGRVLWFISTAVFDVSQTEGGELPAPPIPDPELLTGDDQGMLARLVSLLLPEGWRVEIGDARGANGFCNHADKLVMIEQERDPAQQVKTLIHELAHASLHGPNQVDYLADRGRCEVEAESVAHVVLAALGQDTTRYSLSYVANWANGKTEVVRETAGNVLREAQRMLDILMIEETENSEQKELVSA